MQIITNIETDQLIDAIGEMPIEDKLKLYDKIKDDIFEFRFREILDQLKTDELSEEEILQEVENVRSERYKNRS
jgi:hypothetical protein